MRCNEKTLRRPESCENGSKQGSKIKHSLLRIPAGRRRRRGLRFYPLHQQGNYGVLFLRPQRPALRNTMPPPETSAATTRTGMLSLEHRMTAHGGLTSVLRGIGGSQAQPDKISRMGTNCVHTHALNIGGIITRQPETAAERGLHQTRQRREHERKRNRRAEMAQAVSEKDDVTETISCSHDPGTYHLPS